MGEISGKNPTMYFKEGEPAQTQVFGGDEAPAVGPTSVNSEGAPLQTPNTDATLDLRKATEAQFIGPASIPPTDATEVVPPPTHFVDDLEKNDIKK